MIHVTCRLTAKNRDQLRNPTLGNQVWATFTFNLPITTNDHYIIQNLLPTTSLQCNITNSTASDLHPDTYLTAGLYPDKQYHCTKTLVSQRILS